MILDAESIISQVNIQPFAPRTKLNGLSYGLGNASYDFRLKEELDLMPGDFMLGSFMEYMEMPNDVAGLVKDKSTLARLGLSVFNTFIDPGWRGHLTVEIKNLGPERIRLPAGSPICQVVFIKTLFACEAYEGKYQDQPDRAVEAIL